MLSDYEKAKIVELSGLNYRQGEIAKKLNLTYNQVNYCLTEVKDMAKRDGDDIAFMKILVNGFGPEVMHILSILSRYEKKE
ncbi:hypothetical protein KAT92_05995 [Candidatus Babeliales bacterium]|nr:hypothetical protein [Candidatus Babeliales bacterium]